MQQPAGTQQPAAAGSAAEAAGAAGSGDEAYAAVARALRDSDKDADARLREARSAFLPQFWLITPILPCAGWYPCAASTHADT